MERDGVARKQLPRSAHRLLWKIGRAVEKHIRDTIIDAVDFQGVLGGWQCACEATSYVGEHTEQACPKCQKRCDTYCEISLMDDAAKVAGHPDMLLVVERHVHVMEIKSINKKDFDALEGPLPDHVFQAGSYVKMLKETVDGLPHPVSDTAIFVYGCKDFSFKGQPYKEYHVAISKNPISKAIKQAWAEAHATHVFKSTQTKGLPPRWAACHCKDTATAKGCPCVVNCFARKG